MYILLLIILGLALRLINIDKPEGLWNDEYVSWFVASTPFKEDFLGEILKQCHMPLYYFYLKPFSGCSDLVLRLTSLLPSLIAIPIMFLVGKEFSKKSGYICAGITATLPFLVYYSQEVRFYSLLFLFSAISLLFLVRIIKGENRWLGFGISSALILLTHVLGILYVGFSLAYIAYKKNKLSKKIIFSIILAGLIILPLGTNILKMLPSSQWWGHFSYTNILFLFSDYLSPILTNNVNAPNVFFYSKNMLFLTLITIPTLLGSLAIIRGGKQAKGLSLIALSTVFITAILALSGKLVFITKYTIEILPILILLLSLGIKGRIGSLVLSIFIAFQLFSVFTPYYPAKIYRSEGHKLVADVLNKVDSSKIIFTYYDVKRFEKYLNKDADFLHISKINRFEYIEAPERILDNIKKDEVISVVFLDSVSFIPDFWIEDAKSKQVPEMFITFSIIRNKLTQKIKENYTDIDITKTGSWTIISAKKLR